MKILIIDQDDTHIKNLNDVLVNDRNYSVDISNTFEDTQKYYPSNQYDIIIIDFEISGGLESLKYILNINKKQKIITQSAFNGCSEIAGCEYCVTNNYKKRLVKRCSVKDILYVIDNFDNFTCHHQNEFN